VFSLPIEAERKLIGGDPPAGVWELYPSESWNYGLDVDTDDPESSVSVEIGAVNDVPFSPDNPPIELSVEGRLVPRWHLEDNWAGEIPYSPARVNEEPTELTLIPYGATNLRVTEFPIID